MEGAGPKCDGQQGSWTGSGKGWKHLLCLRRDHTGEGDREWERLGGSGEVKTGDSGRGQEGQEQVEGATQLYTCVFNILQVFFISCRSS